MANRARGEATLELGGEKYVLRPEFGVIAEIEDELDTDMFRVKELAHALRVILEANGYEAEEKRLAKAIAQEGMAAVVLPLVAFVHGYVWGAQPEKKAGPTETPTTPSTSGDGQATPSESS